MRFVWATCKALVDPINRRIRTVRPKALIERDGKLISALRLRRTSKDFSKRTRLLQTIEIWRPTNAAILGSERGACHLNNEHLHLCTRGWKLVLISGTAGRTTWLTRKKFSLRGVDSGSLGAEVT